VLAALESASGTAAYGFFTSPSDLLGGLTPIEALTGKLTNPHDLETRGAGVAVRGRSWALERRWAGRTCICGCPRCMTSPASSVDAAHLELKLLDPGAVDLW